MPAMTAAQEVPRRRSRLDEPKMAAAIGAMAQLSAKRQINDLNIAYLWRR
jgi:hypothetical protein